MDHSSYKNYLLILLSIILAFNYLDRWALGIVLEDIKIDLDLSDTQLGFLSGIAFAAFYAVMGIPIARWADRGNRVTVIGFTTALWSAAVALCGVAASFVQLLMVRVGVAVGEAGCIPPAHSLIADNFTRAERPRAVSRYMLGLPLSLVFGYFASGWLNELFGWRLTFILIGLPGLLLAALAWFTVKEPREMLGVSTVIQIGPTPGMREVVATLWANAAFRHLVFCFSVWYFFGYGLQQWLPAYFVRSHALTTGEIGTWFAAIYGIGGGLGVYLGGELATRYAAGNERLQLNACAFAFAFFSAVNAVTFLAPSYSLALGALFIANLGGNMAQGPILATIQTLVPARMRAMSLAVVYLFANLIGMGLGPLAAGALSDGLRSSFGEESLRYALVILCPGYFWAAWHLWRAGTTVARDVSASQGDEIAPAAIPAGCATVK